MTIAEQAEHWPTPTAADAEPRGHSGETKMGRTITHEAKAMNVAHAGGARPPRRGDGADHLDAGTGHKHLDQLPNYVEHVWQSTPRTTTSSDCFLPGLLTPTDGDASSPCDPTSPPRSREMWKTPHGFANMDAGGKVAGGGGEFAKQAMRGSSPKARLNPKFVEWLMGMPCDYTAVASTDCARVATEWSRYRRRLRSALSRLAR